MGSSDIKTRSHAVDNGVSEQKGETGPESFFLDAGGLDENT